MLSEGDVVAAGVSGGADSVCLLFVLLQLRQEIPFSLAAVHVNHGIRPEAGQDAAYVEKLCGRLGVPFYLVERDVRQAARESGCSTEEAGRKIRYAALRQALAQMDPAAVAQGRGKIAVAHNSNDRAETMLFHLFRGTGLTGLCGIRPVRGQVIRPLLCVERWEIEAFLKEKGISYCIDRTNQEDTYTRNRIRRHILPYVEQEIAGNAVAHMGSTSELLMEAEDFVRQETQRAYEGCVTEKAGALRMDIGRMQEKHPLLRKRLILRCLEGLIPARRDITAVHVRSIEELTGKDGSPRISLPYGICVRREYGDLVFERTEEDAAGEPGEPRERGWEICPEPACQVKLPGLGILRCRVFSCEKNAEIPQNRYTKWFDYDKIKKSLMVRNRRTGDYLTINKALSRKSLQDYMVNTRIPRKERDSIWLLADGEHILWVIGYRISEAYKVGADTKRVLEVQLGGGQEDGGTHQGFSV